MSHGFQGAFAGRLWSSGAPPTLLTHLLAEVVASTLVMVKAIPVLITGMKILLYHSSSSYRQILSPWLVSQVTLKISFGISSFGKLNQKATLAKVCLSPWGSSTCHPFTSYVFHEKRSHSISCENVSSCSISVAFCYSKYVMQISWVKTQNRKETILISYY